MKVASTCAIAFSALILACEPEPPKTMLDGGVPDGAPGASRSDGGCGPDVPSGADAGGLVSSTYPSCCFPVISPWTRPVTATRSAGAPTDGGNASDGGDPSDGGVPDVIAIPAHEAFPSATSARWTGATQVGDGAELQLDIDGASWTVAVEYAASVPEVPSGGVEVEIVADSESFTLTRASDGALLLTWVRSRPPSPIESRVVRGIELALSDACYGWHETPFGCGIGVLVYSLEVSVAGELVDAPPRSTITVALGGADYAITNRLVSGGGGSNVPMCGALVSPAFDVDIVISAL